SRANTRCGGEPLKRTCYRPWRNWESASFHLALLGKASSRERSTNTRRLTIPTSATPSLALRQRLEKRIRLWLIYLARSGNRRRRPLRRSRLLGYLLRSRGLFPSQV